MLLVSAGDLYGGSDAYNRPKCQFIARMMKRFGIDAVALGEKDLNFGLDAIEKDDRDIGMNVICANVFAKTQHGADSAGTAHSAMPASAAPAFPAYRIIERGGVRFGVIAVLSPAAKNERDVSESGDVEALTYVIKAPRPILESIVPAVRAQSDFVLLLAHMTKSELSEMLAGLEGIDMVILGHSGKPQVTAEPVMVDSVPTYMASHQGQYLGRARVSFDAHRRVSSSTNEIRLLDDSVRSD
jgi:2',3'-cyclic-nucleotide 2'-phosphodiesterase (5'-nucleotidase family)